MIEPLPFQNNFLRKAFEDGNRLNALSIPRGNGKSTLCGALILARCLTPGDPLHEPGREYLLVAGSIEQARHSFRPLREILDSDDYSFTDSARALGVLHKPTNTKLRVLSSSGKRAMGIVGSPICVCDEPGSWQVREGELMYESLLTAQGKPDSDLRLIFIGTIAPAQRGWWPDLVKSGSNKSEGRFVKVLQADEQKWSNWNEVKRVNPLMAKFPDSRKVLRSELKAAKKDSRLEARFKSYRLNLPSSDSSEMLLNLSEWETCLNRPVGDDEGDPVIGVDMGSRRSWSAAVALFPSGRVECFCLAGDEDIDALEARDLVPSGTYQELIEDESLLIDTGHKVPRAEIFANEIERRWPTAWTLIGDRFRTDELEDYWHGECIVRVAMWKQASEDIRALRSIALDGELSIELKSRKILTYALMHSLIENDTSGNSRMIKTNMRSKTARDDAGSALIMAAGEHHRQRIEAETAQEVEFISI